MSAFSSRPRGYKLGLVMLVWVSGVYLVGFAAPYWLSGSSSSFFGHEGIWMGCVTEKSTRPTICVTYGITGVPPWFMGVRALLCLCTVGLCTACLYGLLTNCCRTFPGPRTRVLETLGILSGLLGFAGCLTYALLKSWLEFLSWAFYFAIIGSGLSVVAGIIVAVTNKKQEGHSGGVVMTTVTSQPGYAPRPQGLGANNAPQPYPNNAPEPYNPYSGNVTQPCGYADTRPQPYMPHQGYASDKQSHSAPY